MKPRRLRPVIVAELRLFAVGILLLTCAVRASENQDWPTFARDHHRGAATEMVLPLPLTEVWVHRAEHAPSPAWPPPARFDYWHYKQDLHPRVTYDHAFQVTAIQDRVFYGSSTDDSVVCLDAATGTTRWTFFTEAPVRLAPTIVDGRLYAGSDDGHVYCLSPDDGRLIWKSLIGPHDSRCIGNQRVISRWPIRSGVLISDGLAYCAAGLFPTSEGVFLAALDATTGTPQWRQKIPQSAQGYMALTRERLIIPSGRTQPFAYRRSDGSPLGEIASAGGVYTVVASDVVATGQGDTEGQLALIEPDTQEHLITLRGLHLISSGSRFYIHSRTELAALDRAQFLPLARRHAVLKRQLDAATERQDARTEADTARLKRELAELDTDMQKCWLWKTPCDHVESLIVAGDKLFAGGRASVAAYDMRSGREVWRGMAAGRACGLAAAHGQLLVSTDQGSIHCFSTATTNAAESQRGAASAADARAARAESRHSSSNAEGAPTILAQSILAGAPSDQGYCLIIGGHDGQLAAAIAQQSRMRVIVAQPDSRIASRMRDRLREEGLYGTRAVVHEMSLQKLPYPPYFANLLVITSPTTFPLSAAAQNVQRLLRPHGGQAWIEPSELPDPQARQRWSEAIADEAFSVTSKQLRHRRWTVVQRGPLPGGGAWTHGLADAGNTACSMDQLVQGPLRLQWFGRPGPRLMADRHHRNVPPLSNNGRLFVPGDNLVIAVDAYNGTQLWQRDIPNSLRLGAFLDCSNMVVDDRDLYVVAQDKCHVLDSSTGATRRTIGVPQLAPGPPHYWGYLARTGELLVGSGRKPEAAYHRQSRDDDLALWFDNMSLVTSDYLFAMAPEGGAPAWTYQSGILINSTIAIGGEQIYFLESHSPKAIQNELGRAPMSAFMEGKNYLVALDLGSGKTVWKQPFDLSNCQHIVYVNYAQGKLLVSGNRYVNRSLWYFFQALDASNGQRVWSASHDAQYRVGGDHGEQNRHPTIVGDTVYTYPRAYQLHTGQQIEGWRFDRIGHGCGNISAATGCIFWRGGNPWQWDLKPDRKPVRINSVNRPGCFINIVPAGGMLLIPEASSGCTCGFPLQTSMAYVPAGALE